LPAETGGSFTNAQKVIQEFEPGLPKKTGKTNIEQLSGIIKTFGINGATNPIQVFSEMIALLPQGKDHSGLTLNITGESDSKPLFAYGCDDVVRRFEIEFANAFTGH
jgi:hypothetical protein